MYSVPHRRADTLCTCSCGFGFYPGHLYMMACNPPRRDRATMVEGFASLSGERDQKCEACTVGVILVEPQVTARDRARRRLRARPRPTPGAECAASCRLRERLEQATQGRRFQTRPVIAKESA